MLDALNNATLAGMDFLLGWMLRWPLDVVLVVVAIITSLALTFVRLYTTNQDLLARCKQDKTRLKQLIRTAKKARDKPAVQRHRTTIAQIGMKTMRAEGKPLLVTLIPISALAIWAMARLAYVPPQPGQPIAVKARFSPAASASSDIVHLAPTAGLQASDGWVKRVADDADAEQAEGVANWTLLADAQSQPYTLQVRYRGQTFDKALLVDGRRYAAPVETYDDDRLHSVELDLKPYKPFGVIPELAALWRWLGWSWQFSLDAWLVGYLLIAIPLVFLLKWMFGIY